MAAFVLAMIVENYPPGQDIVYQGKVINSCLLLLDYQPDYRLRAWCALCLGKVWLYSLTSEASVPDCKGAELQNV